MSIISCKLICSSNSGHIQQIYTGFFMLYKRGLIDLSQQIKKDHNNLNHLQVIVNKKVKVYYDMHDGCRISEKYLDESDFYFKRSFNPAHCKYLGEKARKIRPLGLNYYVLPDALDRFALPRSLFLEDNKRKKAVQAMHALNILYKFVFAPRVHIMEAMPDYNVTPRILFMVRAWDPYDKPGRPEERIKERILHNETRANCIRMLRNEFGNHFYGGFCHTKYAKEKYKDLLLPDKQSGNKVNYIKMLKLYPICVATTGIHGSIGWKYSEYVAFSKAILSEKLNYEVPGNLKEGRNYLEFSSPEECVAKAKQLFCDHELRKYIMTNNSEYYQSYLRPDSLVQNSLVTALSEI